MRDSDSGTSSDVKWRPMWVSVGTTNGGRPLNSPRPPAKEHAELDSSQGCGCGFNLDNSGGTMMKRFSATLLALAILAFGSGVSLLAHEGHEHKVMGTVTMAAADHLMLKDKDGKDVTTKVTKDTKVKGKQSLKVEDIKPGTRVV